MKIYRTAIAFNATNSVARTAKVH